MANNKKTISNKHKQLLFDLEEIIGEYCYNKNIQNYNNWEKEDEGRWIRYPIYFEDQPGYLSKTKCPEDDYPINKITSKKIRSGHYKFGANELYIMQALIGVIEYLEDKYELDVD